MSVNDKASGKEADNQYAKVHFRLVTSAAILGLIILNNTERSPKPKLLCKT